MKRRYSQLDEVDQLKNEIAEAEEALIRLRKTLTTKMNELQKICTHDEFIAEDNGDCHKSGYYYICTDCRMMFCRKPTNSVVIYPGA